MILALVVAYRLWWLVPGLLPTLYYGSRAPILALGAAVGLALWRRSRFAALLTTLGVALFVVTFMAREGGPHGLFESDDLMQRIGVWQDLIPHLTVWGHGLGSFIVEYPLFQHHTNPLILRFENVHNDFLQVAYELGLVGAVLVLVLLMRMTAAPASPAWYVMVVFLVEAVFGFPLYEPVSGALAACCAGVIFAGCTSLRGLLPDRGSRIWARVADYELGSFRARGSVFPFGPFTPFWTGLQRHHAARTSWGAGD
jgi:O-antigen ligase